MKRVVRQIEAAAREAKVTVDKIELLDPLGLAVATTIRVSDPAQFLDQRMDRFAEALSPPTDLPTTDVYLLFVDARGKAILELGNGRTGGGESASGWVRPDLVGCYNPAMSRPEGWTPPACPVSNAGARLR